jgi:5-deoxy-D-glucuronate isomerase
MQIDVLEIPPIKNDSTLVRVVVAHNQLHDCRLTTTRIPHQCCLLYVQGKIEVSENILLFVLWVGKSNIFEDNHSFEVWRRNTVR